MESQLANCDRSVNVNTGSEGYVHNNKMYEGCTTDRSQHLTVKLR
jgi:hypothetical protein